LCIATSNQDKIDRAVPSLLREGFEVLGVPVDVRQTASVQTMVSDTLDAFGRIDILVCSHGYSNFGDVVDQDEDEWLKVLDVDLIGCYRCSKAALPGMLKQKWGRIIYVSATSAFRCEAGWTAKCTAKTGLLGLTRGLALEVAQHNITVNAVCPAWVRTERAEFAVGQQAKRDGKPPEQLWEEIVAAYPMKRVTEPDEQADLMLYLASEAARSMTGQAIALTAGAEW
jgi:NAD(P)-dependent dehydrogenase (short-subunit alcohol dehydrogenase family)